MAVWRHTKPCLIDRDSLHRLEGLVKVMVFASTSVAPPEIDEVENACEQSEVWWEMVGRRETLWRGPHVGDGWCTKDGRPESLRDNAGIFSLSTGAVLLLVCSSLVSSCHCSVRFGPWGFLEETEGNAVNKVNHFCHNDKGPMGGHWHNSRLHQEELSIKMLQVFSHIQRKLIRANLKGPTSSQHIPHYLKPHIANFCYLIPWTRMLECMLIWYW